MSERETRFQTNQQNWKGVDQRTQPTLVKDDFFVMSKGVLFGSGDNAERLPGKALAFLLPQGVFNIVQFGNMVFIQTFAALQMVSVEELLSGIVIAPPVGTSGITAEDGTFILAENGNNILPDP